MDIKEPATYAAALAGMVDRPFLASDRYRQEQHRAVRDGAHPDILEFERVMIRKMAKLGAPMFASEVMRSAKRQDELYALGNSRARGGQSPHQWGCAVDLVHAVKGWGLSRKEWQLIGHTGEELVKAKGLAIESAVEWGGEWKFYDPAHWQLANWKQLKEGYPEWPKAKRYR